LEAAKIRSIQEGKMGNDGNWEIEMYFCPAGKPRGVKIKAAMAEARVIDNLIDTLIVLDIGVGPGGAMSAATALRNIARCPLCGSENLELRYRDDVDLAGFCLGCNEAFECREW
jgi:hypothetical protein